MGFFDLLEPGQGWAVLAGGAVLLMTGTVGLRAAGSGLVERVRSRRGVAHYRRRVRERMIARERDTASPGGEAGWEGFRRFRVQRKVWEDAGRQICSFYLEPEDGRALPDFRPGQFLTFRVPVQDANGVVKQVVRCYSLSCGAHGKPYRISVKRMPAPPGSDHPPGLLSNHLHDQIEEGDVLNVKAPGGDFYLDPDAETPVVLIGGGIGITPVFSMMDTLARRGSNRRVWLFLGLRSRQDLVFGETLERWTTELENFTLVQCISDPDEGEGEPATPPRRVSLDLIREHTGSLDCDYYLCGPPPMMKALVEAFDAAGIPESRVHFEAFGPASVRRAPQAGQPAGEVGYPVAFRRSGVTVRWDSSFDSLLACAEANGVVIDAGCRAGNCGTCAAVVEEGEVSYLSKPKARLEPGTCLTCVSVPASALTFDL